MNNNENVDIDRIFDIAIFTSVMNSDVNDKDKFEFVKISNVFRKHGIGIREMLEIMKELLKIKDEQ